MNRSRFKRFVGVFMAAVTLVTSVQLALPAEAAVTRIPIFFKNPPRPASTRSAGVIVGNQINFGMTPPADHVLKTNAFSFTPSTGIAGGTPTPGAITSGGSDVSNKFFTAGPGSAVDAGAVAGFVPYTIYGEFYAIQAAGYADETWGAVKVPADPNQTPPPGPGDTVVLDEGGVARADVICTTSNAIQELSTIILECTVGEGGGGALFPAFDVRTGSGTGALLGYESVKSTVISGTGTTKKIEVIVAKSGGASLTLQITPKQKHSVFSGNYDPITHKPIPKSNETNNDILTGTTYTITFDLPRTEDLMLTVVTPKYVTNLVAEEIGNTGANYIFPAEGNDVNWLTKDFKVLTKKTTEYHSQIKKNNMFADFNTLEWKWVPDATQPGAPPGITDFQDVLKVGRTSFGTDAIVEVFQRDYDVTGHLVASVSYAGAVADSGGSMLAVSTREVPVKIKGKGKPPYLEMVSTTTGTVVKPVTGNQNNFPTVMDVYDGSVPGFTPTEPYLFDAIAYFGGGNAASEHMTITSSDPDAVEVYLRGTVAPYKFGAEIKNETKDDDAHQNFQVKAKTGGKSATLTFHYFTRDKDNKLAETVIVAQPIWVGDTTPSPDATLGSLEVLPYKDATNPLDYEIDVGFAAGTTQRQFNIKVPYQAENVKVKTAANHGKATVTAVYKKAGDTNSQEYETGNSFTTGLIPLAENVMKTVTLRVQAENTNIAPQYYTLNITRQPKDPDSTLKTLQVFAEGEETTDLVPAFDPKTLTYKITVPYGVKKAKVEAQANSRWADVKILPASPAAFSFWERDHWVALGHPKDPGGLPANPTIITVTVTAEDPAAPPTVYTVEVTRADPSEDNRLSLLAVTNDKGTPFDFDEGRKFDKDTPDYYLTVPYSASSIRFKTAREHQYATSVTLVYPRNADKVTEPFKKDGTFEFRDVAIPVATYPQGEKFMFRVYATAESGSPVTVADAEQEPYLLYTVEFTRNPPDTDTRLESLTLTDQGDKAVDTFSFNTEQLVYDIKVPYLTELVKVTPKAKSTLSIVTVNGSLISDSHTYVPIPLVPDQKETVTVLVTAESGATRTYTINITREKPSTEARLESLVVTGGIDFKPRFTPSGASYTVTIPDGTKGFTVTAKPYDPFATMQINDRKAESGVPFGPIIPADATSRVTVTVTAQDGKTKKVYTITVTDENLIEKSTNADLASLKVEAGEMSPRFKPAVENYEVYVKNDTSYVDIIPKPANRYATMEVYAGTKLLGDAHNNFSSAITDDENEFSVKVTSQDKKVIKTYNVIVYRNDDDKKGNLKPITDDMVDYEGESPILVDISKYPIVTAPVLNRMKDYPDKTIIFQGNDYSLEMKGSDLKTLVPNTESFDFSLSFTSPEEDAIWDILDSRRGNEHLNPVFVYFSHHGQLPAPMKFTLSLGRRYQNRTLYWNYYNEERERIDYYGSIPTNAKGTFSVKLTHMSTYPITREKIIGAENKVGMGYGETEDLSAEANKDKVNPNTGLKREGTR